MAGPLGPLLPEPPLHFPLWAFLLAQVIHKLYVCLTTSLPCLQALLCPHKDSEPKLSEYVEQRPSERTNFPSLFRFQGHKLS
jgi:hypothetical protein